MCTIAESIFEPAFAAITKSDVALKIETYYEDAKHSGGRRTAGIDYTVTAVLTALLARFLMGRPYSLRGAMDTIGEFSPSQLAAVGMPGQDCSAIHTAAAREYKRFHRYWALRMKPLDPDADLPSRRMTNAEFQGRIQKRTLEDLAASKEAGERLTSLINDLLYGSIDDPHPPGCVGDVIVDETLINTAMPDGTLGMKGQRYRGASTISKYWVRDKARNLKTRVGGAEHSREIKSHGFGVGATFVSRVAARNALHSEPAVFIGMDVHLPTGASVEGLATALAQARRTGLDARGDGRQRWPLLTADMGYNAKNGFGELMVRTRYSPVVRYPAHWGLNFPSASPPGAPDGPAPGPIQHVGTFFCPAVGDRIHGHRTPKTTELLSADRFRDHDRRLKRIYPFAMAFNSRPALVPVRFGRPRHGAQVPQCVKVRLVCPAAMGTLRCTLKPESLNTETPGLPLVEPAWAAHELACCAKSSVTVYLTDDQLRVAQWDLIPGGWEHTGYYEAARAKTEQRFSQLKSKYVAGLDSLTAGPRRTPMIKIAVALAAVTANIYAQRHHSAAAHREESIDIKMRQLSADLGHPPTKMPPRS